MDKIEIKNIVEAALMAAGRPLNVDGLLSIFGDGARPERGEIREVVNALQEEYESRGIELVEVASGFRIQVASSMSDWLSRLSQDRPQRYSRALMETLALIAYRQPITRGEIEDVRGVSVSSNIIRTLLERTWIRVVGHRDVPGRPEMFGTTREFLDYFGLRRLDELPSLAELRDLDSFNVELDLGDPGAAPQVAAVTLVPDAGAAAADISEEQPQQMESPSDDTTASLDGDADPSPEPASIDDESPARA